jgi:hypothetical protein
MQRNLIIILQSVLHGPKVYDKTYNRPTQDRGLYYGLPSVRRSTEDQEYWQEYFKHVLTLVAN